MSIRKRFTIWKPVQTVQHIGSVRMFVPIFAVFLVTYIDFTVYIHIVLGFRLEGQQIIFIHLSKIELLGNAIH